MTKLYDYLRGTKRLEITGAQPERVLNALAGRGIEFWDCAPGSFSVRFTVAAADAGEAEALAGKCMCEAKTLSDAGGKKLRRAAKRRRALLVCLCLIAAALCWSSLYVWDIEVVGNRTVSTGRILRALEENGVAEGAFWPGISSEMAEAGVMPEIPEIGWMTVNVRSSKAVVKIVERVPKPELLDRSAPTNVVAAKTGIIEKMSVLQGSAAAEPGSAVLEGETLISGAMESISGQVRIVHAQGAVQARTLYSLTSVCPAEEAAKTEKGRARSRFALIIGRNRINFYSGSRKAHTDCDKIIRKYTLAVPGAFTLPVTVVKETFVPYKTTASRVSAAERMKAALMDELKSRLAPGGEILTGTFSQSSAGGLETVTLRAECRENIAGIVPMPQSEIDEIRNANLNAEKENANDRTDH